MTTEKLKRMLNELYGKGLLQSKTVSSSKENIMKHLSEAHIMIGGKLYPAKNVDYSQTYDEFPTVRVTASISPYCVRGLAGRNNDFIAAIPTSAKTPQIENVIFNPPATIVFWTDHTKTVVKCDLEHELYDPEKGLAMAISKKLLGNNKHEYYNTFKHYLKKWYKYQALEYNIIKTYSESLKDALNIFTSVTKEEADAK